MAGTITEQGEARVHRRLPARALEATVLDPPLTEDEGFLRVEVDAQPGRARECPWQPRPDDVEPSAGDAALCLESDAGNVWVVCWWPQ